VRRRRRVCLHWNVIEIFGRRQGRELVRRVQRLATGEEPRRTGNDHPIVSPYGMFRTSDGEIALAPSQEQS